MGTRPGPPASAQIPGREFRKPEHLKFRVNPADPKGVRTTNEYLELGVILIGLFGFGELLYLVWIVLHP
jgi:hypothetical protein